MFLNYSTSTPLHATVMMKLAINSILIPLERRDKFARKTVHIIMFSVKRPFLESKGTTETK